MRRLFFMVLGLGLFFCAMTGAAQAQATRTWVSGVGDDANPCSRTAPCKTFPGAYSKTAVGGEIDVIDPGGFGTITIGHALIIDGGGGVMASILGSSTYAVTINAASTDKVELRNLTLQGISQSSFPGTSGIILNSGRLSVSHCIIENWSQYGIKNDTTQATRMSVRDTIFDNITITGIYSNSTVATNFVSLSNSAVYNSGGGIWMAKNAAAYVNESTFTNNTGGAGLYADPGAGGTNSTIDAVRVTTSGNQTGMQAQNGGNVNTSMSMITLNMNGVVGTVHSSGDNYLYNNTTSDGVFVAPAVPKT